MTPNLSEEIEQVFQNIKMTLHEGGIADGWSAVYLINSYQSQSRVPGEDQVFAAILPSKGKYMKDNRCVWSHVTVPSLHGGAAVEVTVSAVKSSQTTSKV